MKRCSKCKEVKSKSCFTKAPKRKDGLRPQCKDCSAAYNAARKDITKEYGIAYRAANADLIKAKKAEYYAANTEKVAASQSAYYVANRSAKLIRFKAYYANNKSVMNAQAADYYAANSGKAKRDVAAWRARNPEARRRYESVRRSRKVGVGGKLSIGLIARLFKLQRGKCACCGIPLGNNYHLDHIMPLALGGSNTDENIQLLRATCNAQKSAKHPVDFMQQRGFLL